MARILCLHHIGTSSILVWATTTYDVMDSKRVFETLRPGSSPGRSANNLVIL